jgi:hypothetical protein
MQHRETGRAVFNTTEVLDIFSISLLVTVQVTILEEDGRQTG